MWRSKLLQKIRLEKVARRAVSLTALAIASIILLGSLAFAQEGYRDFDRDDYRYGSFRIARDCGWEDGARVAREDLAKYKPYQPYPRGKYTHEDHGYRREYGDKYAYEQEYARAYQQAYERTFRRY